MNQERYEPHLSPSGTPNYLTNRAQAPYIMTPIEHLEHLEHLEQREQREQRAIANAGEQLQLLCHAAAQESGWWNDLTTGQDFAAEMRASTRLGKALVAEKLCLIHSEVSEAMEGHRKGLMDDKLPHRSAIEVELADAVIRIADLCGALGLDLGGAIAEKMAFNASREDHRPENRVKEGGKAY